ncbi:hypothetical protein GM3708_322 [Geminocystis sp. NIES-3708]|uniref:hypothetical protein n=1 Tax=Geminocystis sp. NIES-3708 TaxID=1615909 RepID=UPI0005FC53BE|nr:hypothetical protein [Geminocystis sp. NIES-3708]BAQ59916.1 hypothetical protein GM3708_322 [Geminocystis sp. NIES-3708]
MTIKQLALISDFVTANHGKYIVKVSVYSDGVILGSALAGEDTVEKAEDEARKRAITLVNTDIFIKGLIEKDKIINVETSVKTSQVKISSESEFLKTSKKDSPKIKSNIKSLPIEEKPNSEVLVSDSPDLWESTASFPANQDEIEQNDFQDIDNDNLENISEPSLSPSPIENQEVPSLLNNEPIHESNGNSNDDNLILFPPSTQEEDLPSESVLPLPLDVEETIDFSQIIDQTSIEMKRLGWTQDQGKKYLLETYGKKSRHLLSDEELIEFLQYLKTQ